MFRKTEIIKTTSLGTFIVTVLTSNVAAGVVQEFTNHAQWEAAVGTFTTIDFTGFPSGTLISNQFADQGLLFTDGNDGVLFSPAGFINDQWGLSGQGGMTLEFNQPQAYISVDFPGDLPPDYVPLPMRV